MRLALAAAGLLAAACGGGGQVSVFAASSLTDVLPAIVERYREQHPQVELQLRFAGSQTLAAQIEEGATADIFISAHPSHADRLVAEGRAERPTVLAENGLVIAVRAGAPWRTVEEVAAAGVRLAVGSPDVPVGMLTRAALAALDPAVAASLRASVVTEDPNVRVVLSRVEIGEADAAFVYRTDVTAAAGVRAIEAPGLPRTEYVAVLLTDRDREDGDRAAGFLEFLAGPEAGALLSEAGFFPPAPGATP